MNKIFRRRLAQIIAAVSLLAGLQIFNAAGQKIESPGRDIPAKVKSIEEKVEARRKALGIPGMSLVIVKDGEIIYLNGFGYKDFENRVAVTPDTEFAIGSATKAFTALSVLMSQEEGRLSIDDSPKKYLPYFKINDPETDKNIKVRDLLTHSSGLARTDLAWLSGKLTREEIIRVAGEAKPTAKLHEKFQYQNVMFAAAGEIVEQVQKMPWEKFVAGRILKPLGMNNSTLSLKEMTQAKDFSYGYRYEPDTGETRRLPFVDADEISPAGAINSSARDMAKWLQFVLSGGVAGGKRLISEKDFDEWTKPQMKTGGNSSYGFGWFIQDWKGLKVIQHGGNIDGFNSMVAMIPEKKLGFVMLTNVSASSLGAELMPIVWEGILDSSNHPTSPTLTISQSKSSALSKSAAEELAGRYVSASGKTIAEIKETDNRVSFTLTGQQPNELRERQKDFYEIYPLPETFGLKVRRDAQGKVEGFTVIQPQSEVSFSRLAKQAEMPKITIDELMAKTIDALGGETALKKIISRKTIFDIDFEEQGLKGIGTRFTKAPDLSSTETTITALGKPIAEKYEYFDGTGGGEKMSFTPEEIYGGSKLEDVKITSGFYGLLNWKASQITGIEKVGDEDAFTILMSPEKANQVIYYISAKTFLPLKRTILIASGTSNVKIPLSESYEDYRLIDGVKIPFKTVSESFLMGRIVSYLKTVENNVEIPANIFKTK